MASPLVFLPFLVALGLVGVLLAAKTTARVGTVFTRIALILFNRFVSGDRPERERLLEAAYIPETYRAYAAKSYLHAVVLSVIGGILGGYAIAGFIVVIPAVGDFLAGLPRAMTAALGNPRTWRLDLPTPVFYTVAIVGGLVAGALTGVVAYVLRWQRLEGKAEVRRRHINESLARTVAFLYALSRGGMPFPNAMRTLADNRRVYGETAAEVSVAVREIDLFGTDVINAVRRMSQRTPSEELKTFGENLASVLQSGQNLPNFLSQQYERYREESRERQEEVLELLATIAEAYVTLFVAGVLFLITVLLVFGLTTTDTLWIIQLLAYLVIPLGNIGFIVFLDQRLSLLGIGAEDGMEPATSLQSTGGTSPTADVQTPDGGHAPGLTANLERLAMYDRLERLRRVVGRPLQTVLRNPTTLLYVTVPLALLVTALRLPGALTTVGPNIRVLDDYLLQAGLVVMGSYAVVRYVHKQRLQRIEEATPEFLERLASLNEAGMSVVESFERVRGSDLGALSAEVDRIWADISLGANIEAALARFGRRVRTTPITRSVTLLTNAMRASGDIGSVLRIAADEARSDLRMKRQRRREMFTYLVVIYISFFVFLVIIVAVQEVLVPSLPNNVPTPPSNNRLGVNAGQFTRLGDVNKAAYTLVFFHTALLQAVLSGLIAGQIGEGRLRDGAKHAAIMLSIAYVAFLILSGPVASIEMGSQYQNDQLTIEAAELSQGGFIVVHAYTADGKVLGRTGYLPAGQSRDITVQFNEEIPDDATVVAVPHRDTNGNREFDYDGGEVDGYYPPGLESVRAEERIQPGPAPLDSS